MNIKHGVELHHDGDLPARSGLGSSSSFTVGLLHALHALKGEMPSKLQLAKEAIHIEQECIKETVGSQDQVLAAFGGFNYILFHENEDIAVRPVVLPRERISELTSCLLMLYTGIKRTASDIADSYVSEIQDKRREMRIMTDLVNEALTVLNTGSHLAAFGELLHEAWLLKRSLSSKVSNAEVDDLYKTARDLGAKGGKLIGAGGGGFMLLFVEPDLQPRIRDRLSHLVYVPIQFEFTGSQIIFLDRPEEYLSLREEGARRETKPSRELTLSEE
jgi:D-glycero-alpha-D-manno-heptose-7-phosphate kinase